jgi:hypothetical protein
MNALALAAEIDWNKDVGGHQSMGGAIKISRYIGKYLNENFTLDDVRGNPKYKYLERQYKEYTADIENATLLTPSH